MAGIPCKVLKQAIFIYNVFVFTLCVCVCLYSHDYVNTLAYFCVTTSESATHDRKGVMRVMSV